MFIAAATGNLSSYLAYLRVASATPDTPVWTYDIKKVTLSAVLFYGYISVLPLLVWRGCRVRSQLLHNRAHQLTTRACVAHSCTLRCATGAHHRT